MTNRKSPALPRTTDLTYPAVGQRAYAKPQGAKGMQKKDSGASSCLFAGFASACAFLLNRKPKLIGAIWPQSAGRECHLRRPPGAGLRAAFGRLSRSTRLSGLRRIHADTPQPSSCHPGSASCTISSPATSEFGLKKSAGLWRWISITRRRPAAFGQQCCKPRLCRRYLTYFSSCWNREFERR